MNRMASVGGGQRIGIDIGGHGERSGKISYALVTRCFVDHNWEVELHFGKKKIQVIGGVWAVTFKMILHMTLI